MPGGLLAKAQAFTGPREKPGLLQAALKASIEPTFPLMLFWTFVIVGVLITRRGRALRNPGPLRARPRLSLRLDDTKCTIKSQLAHQNPTLRMHMRRFTRLTNAFSKKVENHAYAVALYMM
jgi:hypothetical protein